MTPTRRILVVEDDEAIRTGVVDALEYAGFGIHQAGDGKRGMDLALTCDCDLVLLDLILPGCDGLEILREVRASRPALPVIILTARSEEADRVRGLKLGADDYVIKPFSVQELLARVEAVLRRVPERPDDVERVKIPRGQVNFARREVRFADGKRQELSQREAELLRYLAVNGGRAISRDEILLRVWKLDPTGLDTRTVDMTITRLREKLHDDAEAPKLILTVRGKGYMFAKGSSS